MDSDNTSIINKTMDFDDLKSYRARQIVNDLNGLIKQLKERDLKLSSWYGAFDLGHWKSRFGITGFPYDSTERINRGYGYTSLEGAFDDRNFPWFLYWEIVWVFLNNKFKPGHKALDLGGSSSLFSYYLASKGLNVTTVDVQKSLVDNANFVAGRMNWSLRNVVMDMRKLKFDEKFDHITSICVYEHLPRYDRVNVNAKIRELLVDGGKFSITFDYRNPSMKARIGSPKDVWEQFIEPSGLRIRGNEEFYDSGENYLLTPFFYNKRLWLHKMLSVAKGHYPLRDILETKNRNDYTFGALFLEKASDPKGRRDRVSPLNFAEPTYRPESNLKA